MLEDLEPVKAFRSCKIRTLKDDLDPKDQELLDTYLANVETWTPYKLAKALASKGLRVDYHQITAHRNKICSCKDTVK